MRKILFLVLLLGSWSAFAQTNVTGIVKDQAGVGLPGVTLLVQGTNKGTLTDMDGKFSIQVSSTDVLVVSFVGYVTQEIPVGDQSVIDVSMEVDVDVLNEVVVTALGLKKEKRSIGFAVQEVKSAELNQVSTPNVVNLLAGKVAGLQVTGSGNGVASSSRIVLRGENSLNINKNAPLFVIDGVPVNNEIYGVGGGPTDQADLPTDYGNGIAEINSADIESVNILKGAAASALYGSRASNGVIVITTKKGKAEQGIGVEISSSTMFSSALVLPDLQSSYGGGWAQAYASDFGTNYGPALDGTVIEHELALGEPVERPFINRYDLNDFFETGLQLDNTVALSGATDKIDYRFSYRYNRNTGIVPNTDLTRNSFRLNTGYQITDKWRMDARVNYLKSESDNLPVAGYGSQGIMYTLLWNYLNVDLKDLKNYWITPDEEQRRLFSWGDNPWLIVNENINSFDKKRILGAFTTTYDLTENLKVLGRVGIDESSDFRFSRRPVGSHRFVNGMVREQNVDVKELNMDVLLTYDNRFGELETKFSVGGNRYNQKIGIDLVQGNGLTVPGLYTLSNINVTPVLSSEYFEKEIQSVYGFVNLGYKKFLYLDLTARNDWSSTLPSDNWSYFYPSASVSFISTAIFDLPEQVELIKLRANIAQVGNDTDPLSLRKTYSFGTRPGTFTNPTVLPNADLKPERTTSSEIGLETYFFGQRLYADASYYYTSTKDQIISANVSRSTGYNSTIINAGEIVNSGVELSLGGIPVKTPDFSWELAANFSRNRSEVKSLAPGLESFVIAQGPDNITVEARPGERMGDIYGRTYERNDAGQIIYDESGSPITGTDRKKVGNYNPDWMLGFNTAFSYKNIKLFAQFDYRHGGDLYSYTQAIGRESGTLQFTEGWRDGVVGEGVVSDGAGGYVPNTTEVTAETWAYAVPRSNAEANLFDASYLKLRQVSLSYSLPHKVIESLGVQDLVVSFVGTNLFVWSDVPNIDPEVQGLSGGTILPGIEVTQLPSARTYGFKVNLKF
ncbi:SusC/RagA family TonB-linked outer membrane protein [Reichenbachiella versicolor]|uniref:SusC/RagA family TonB-linked outer membrane protein n=1 Tax=Reichenbachiella versicolor TaxID=1821036 RepID=UPI000D6E9C02|nr:SusC/RagA family TonB-linked outer membrane protein [Reichenbachiella versicolor]